MEKIYHHSLGMILAGGILIGNANYNIEKLGKEYEILSNRNGEFSELSGISSRSESEMRIRKSEIEARAKNELSQYTAGSLMSIIGAGIIFNGLLGFLLRRD